MPKFASEFGSKRETVTVTRQPGAATAALVKGVGITCGIIFLLVVVKVVLFTVLPYYGIYIPVADVLKWAV